MQNINAQVLNLYKKLYRYGVFQLKFTDKKYYNNYIRNQFESVNTSDKLQILQLIKVCRFNYAFNLSLLILKLFLLERRSFS
jgi:hypothetical protein